MFSVLATKPAVSTRPPGPTKMPAGLTSQTRPLDVRLPRMTDGSLASTRLSTLLEAEGWTKRVVCPAPMLNCCQLMIAPLLLVTVRTLPTWLMRAEPLTTWAPTGSVWASKSTDAKQAATARQDRRCRACKVPAHRTDRRILAALDKAGLLYEYPELWKQFASVHSTCPDWTSVDREINHSVQPFQGHSQRFVKDSSCLSLLTIYRLSS